jgi:peptidoglycan DL-endopeptidase CwlO
VPAPRTTSGTTARTAARTTTRRPAGAPAQRPATRTATARTTAARPATGARPALTAREAEALRALLAARQQGATVGGTTVRRAAHRTTSRSAPRRAPARRTRPERRGSSWRLRVGFVAAALLAIPVAASLLVPGPPSPGTGDGPRTTAQLAMAAHTELIHQADRYAKVEDELTSRQIELAAARKAEEKARAAADAARAAVGAGAAELFRSSPVTRVPALALDVRDPSAISGMITAQALADRADLDRERDVVHAERAAVALDLAARTVSAAEARVAAASADAERLLAKTRAQVGGLTPQVAATMAGLSRVPSSGAQEVRNERAVARWQRYLTMLADAGVEPPRATELADPENLPAGMSPALDDEGAGIPGVAWAVIGSSPVTVLPAETVAAVSSALSQLGKPYVPGATGPDTYDCGGFTAAAWLQAGWAVPATPAAQWRTGTAVPTDSLQIGDLVLSPGGLDVGLYLGGGDVLAASAGGYRVAVRSVPAGASAVRVTLGRAEEPNKALSASPAAPACGARQSSKSATVPSPAWGGWSNGRIPSDALCELGTSGHALRCDAAEGYARLAQAYADRFGRGLCITDSYRSIGAQLTAFALKPGLAAVPGTSNHGWALAVDLCGGVNSFGTAEWRWMSENAGLFGWVQPAWAGPQSEKPEPWHWEFGIIS